jgi:hypothetical protein
MSISLALLKKVRCRFLSQQTGAPVPGIVVTLFLGRGDTSDHPRIPVASLCSDGAGYVSFDLALLVRRGLAVAQELVLIGPRLPGREVDLLRTFFRGSGYTGSERFLPADVSSFDFVGAEAPDAGACMVFPVYVATTPDSKSDCGCQDTGHGNSTLPAIQSPDVCDYTASPFSFVTPVSASDGSRCETLAPTSLPVQEHKFFKVVLRRNAEEADTGRLDVIKGVREVSVTDTLATRAPRIKFAEVLEFRQQWISLGHSLGEIKYSLALAAGEATQIAIIDWSRQDTASRTDSATSSEFMDHSTKRDRSIEETIDSALKESQGGSSFMAGTSGQATLPLTYVTLSFNHAIGYGVSNSWGNRDLEAGSLQDLHDKIRQQSGYTRSLNSTVVIQASQSESNTLQTRKVANHNHCHAMTIQYYEVLRHYKIRTSYSGKRKALLVPFRTFLFTADLALQFQSLLRPALIDPTLSSCFDAVLRLRVSPDIYEAPASDDPAPQPTTPPPAEILTKDVTVFTYYRSGVRSQIFVNSGDRIGISASGEAYTGAFQTFGPDGHTDVGTADFSAPGLRKFSLICKIGADGPWRQAGAFAEFDADRNGELVFNMNDLVDDYDNNRPLDHQLQQKDRWAVTVTYPSHQAAPPEPADPQDPNTPPDTGGSSTDSRKPDRAKDELCVARLLAHLNGNQGYYNGCVWVLQNPIERRLRLESALSQHSDLLDGMDDVPLAISGNYVASAYDGPFPAAHEITDPGSIGAIEDIVTLPTRGVFAEAQLGHCNACEERDPTRRWDWKEMTIETPPEIGGVSPGPRGQSPNITPAQLPANVIQITQPPNAPDPTGLAAALRVMGTPGIFRDMSGLDEVSGLLETLSRESSEANIKALALQAKNKLDSAKSSAGGNSSSGTAASGNSVSGRAPAGEADAGKQVDLLKSLEYGRSQGLISDEAAASAAEGIIGGGPLGMLQQMILGAAPGVKRAVVTGSNPGTRACCALGQWNIGRFGALDPFALAGHKLGGGVLSGGPTGYVYTRSAGLIDLGHVRDVADMTQFIFRALLSGTPNLTLYEGEASVFTVPEDIDSIIDLAGAIAYVESWAHELRTWPDLSSFSPEDLCSNMVGVECGKRALRAGGTFNTAMDAALDDVLNVELHAVPQSDTAAVLSRIETSRWFEMNLGWPSLLRRNFDGTPWPAGMPFDALVSLPWLDHATFEPYYSEFTYRISGPVDGRSGVDLTTMKSITNAIRAAFVAGNPGMDRP